MNFISNDSFITAYQTIVQKTAFLPLRTLTFTGHGTTKVIHKLGDTCPSLLGAAAIGGIVQASFATGSIVAYLYSNTDHAYEIGAATIGWAVLYEMGLDGVLGTVSRGLALGNRVFSSLRNLPIADLVQRISRAITFVATSGVSTLSRSRELLAGVVPNNALIMHQSRSALEAGEIVVIAIADTTDIIREQSFRLREPAARTISVLSYYLRRAIPSIIPTLQAIGLGLQRIVRTGNTLTRLCFTRTARITEATFRAATALTQLSFTSAASAAPPTFRAATALTQLSITGAVAITSFAVNEVALAMPAIELPAALENEQEAQEQNLLRSDADRLYNLAPPSVLYGYPVVANITIQSIKAGQIALSAIGSIVNTQNFAT